MARLYVIIFNINQPLSSEICCFFAATFAKNISGSVSMLAFLNIYFFVTLEVCMAFPSRKSFYKCLALDISLTLI